MGLKLSTLASGAPGALLDQLISPINDPPVMRGVIGRGSPVTRGEMGRNSGFNTSFSTTGVGFGVGSIGCGGGGGGGACFVVVCFGVDCSNGTSGVVSSRAVSFVDKSNSSPMSSVESVGFDTCDGLPGRGWLTRIKSFNWNKTLYLLLLRKKFEASF